MKTHNRILISIIIIFSLSLFSYNEYKDYQYNKQIELMIKDKVRTQIIKETHMKNYETIQNRNTNK